MNRPFLLALWKIQVDNVYTFSITIDKSRILWKQFISRMPKLETTTYKMGNWQFLLYEGCKVIRRVLLRFFHKKLQKNKEIFLIPEFFL